MARGEEKDSGNGNETRSWSRKEIVTGIHTKPVRIFDALLTVLDMPIRDGLESGKNRIDSLNTHLSELVGNGIDEGYELLDELNKSPGEGSIYHDNLIDFRQYVLGITSKYEMRPETREWLNSLGISNVLIEEIKNVVPECFEKLVETKENASVKESDNKKAGVEGSEEENEPKKVKMVGGFPVELNDKEVNEFISVEHDNKTTRVLGLDVIQRINYATGDSLVKIPEFNVGGEITGYREIKEVDLSLDLFVDDKNGEVFKALARHFWKDVALHGSIKEKENGEKEITVQGDLDVRLSIEVLKMAGIKVVEEKINFIMPGDERQGMLNVDTSRERVIGRNEEGDIKKKFDGVTTILEEVDVDGDTVWKVTLIIDHHSTNSKSNTSAAKQLYEGLFKLGLIEKIDPLFEKLIDFSTYEDNGTPPKEMFEVLSEYKKKNTESKMGLREFFIKKWPFSAWVHRKSIHLKNYLDFIKKGGDFTEILDRRSDKFESLGLIYTKPDGQRIDRLKQSQENMINALSELQNIEQENGILEIEGVGKIVFDDGAKMRGLGSQICRDLGYDGYISYDYEKKSFMVWTKLPLEASFSQGFKLREHMWVTKPVKGELLSKEDVISALVGERESKWTSGLYEEQKLDNLDGYKRAKNEKPKPEKKNGFWNHKIYKKLSVGGFTPATDAGKAAIQYLKEVGIDLLDVIQKGKDVTKLADAIQTAYKQKTLNQNQFRSVEEAEAYIKEYFSYLNIPDDEPTIDVEKTVEPKFYDGIYDDLWKAENGTDEEKTRAIERLFDNNILLVGFGTDDVAKETYKMALEAIRSNKFVAWKDGREGVEGYIKKLLGVKEKKEAVVEKKEDELWNQETFREMYLGGFRSNESDGVEAIKRLFDKGIDLVKRIKLLNKVNGDLQKASDAVFKLGRLDGKALSENEKNELVETVKKYFSPEESDVVDVAVEKAEEEKREESKEESEPVKSEKESSDERVFNMDVVRLISERNRPQGRSVWDELHKRGFRMKESPDEDERVWEAVDILMGKREGDRQVSEKFLKTYFGVETEPDEGEQKSSEPGELPKPENKEESEKKRIEAIQTEYREMSEDAVFSRFEGWIAGKRSRGGEVLRAWKARVALMPEKDRESVVNQLRSTLMLLENTEARLVHFNYWSRTAMGILRGLSLADKV